jgi:uncharacterized protein (TIGR00255 family)
MIRSMTGFGTASRQTDGTHYALEIRSLNNRYFKAQVRLPEELSGLEAELEAALTKRLTRGSVVVVVRFSDSSAEAAAQINVNAIQQYLQQLLEVRGLDHDSARIDLGTLLALPGIVITDTGEERLEKARDALLGLLETACDEVIAMREREGTMLLRELNQHCAAIAEHLAVVKQRVPQIIELYQEKLRQRMEALLAKSGASAREEDLLREVAVFAERSDIAEEVARLEGHLEQFTELIESDDDTPIGRTLDFIAQEMLREANTIASKCLDVEVSRRIVEIKGAIDRIKEQSQNVE